MGGAQGTVAETGKKTGLCLPSGDPAQHVGAARSERWSRNE